MLTWGPTLISLGYTWIPAATGHLVRPRPFGIRRVTTRCARPLCDYFLWGTADCKHGFELLHQPACGVYHAPNIDEHQHLGCMPDLNAELPRRCCEISINMWTRGLACSSNAGASA